MEDTEQLIGTLVELPLWMGAKAGLQDPDLLEVLRAIDPRAAGKITDRRVRRIQNHTNLSI